MTWTKTPTLWSNNFLENLFKYEWELTKSPAGAKQWVARNAPAIIPDAHDPSKKHKPTVLTTDLTLRFDPEFGKISRRFLEDPLPMAALPAPSAADVADLKARIAASGLSTAQLVSTACASASTFRGSDKRGGANGARIRLAPQKDWEANNPAELAKVLAKLEEIQKASGKVSLADLIVLAGGVGIEQAAKKAGVGIEVPFAPGRVDARQDQTDAESFAVLEPRPGPR